MKNNSDLYWKFESLENLKRGTLVQTVSAAAFKTGAVTYA